MRGKLSFLADVLRTVGITPAHAGKTASAGQGKSARKDHPRACGENGTGCECQETR